MKMLFLLLVALAGSVDCLSAASFTLPNERVRYVSHSGERVLYVDLPKLTMRQYDYLYLGDYALILRESPDLPKEALVTWLSLFEVEDGKENLIWTRPASHVKTTPAAYHVSDGGDVVAIAEAIGGCERDAIAVVVYGGSGRVVKSFANTDLFNEEEISRFSRSPRCVWWEKVESVFDEGNFDRGARIAIAISLAKGIRSPEDSSQLIIKLGNGKVDISRMNIRAGDAADQEMPIRDRS